jgi:hypothetical protein
MVMSAINNACHPHSEAAMRVSSTYQVLQLRGTLRHQSGVLEREKAQSHETKLPYFVRDSTDLLAPSSSFPTSAAQLPTALPCCA